MGARARKWDAVNDNDCIPGEGEARLARRVLAAAVAVELLVCGLPWALALR